jgi:hypothetical protein
VAPDVDVVLNMGQSVHADAPLAVRYVPIRQAVHAPANGPLYEPGAQGRQGPPEPLAVPAVHPVQTSESPMPEVA